MATLHCTHHVHRTDDRYAFTSQAFTSSVCLFTHFIPSASLSWLFPPLPSASLSWLSLPSTLCQPILAFPPRLCLFAGFVLVYLVWVSPGLRSLSLTFSVCCPPLGIHRTLGGNYGDRSLPVTGTCLVHLPYISNQPANQPANPYICRTYHTSRFYFWLLPDQTLSPLQEGIHLLDQRASSSIIRPLHRLLMLF